MREAEKKQLLDRVHALPLELEQYRELLLANVIMVSEIPAPTFAEKKRIAFIKQRFTECGLDSVSSDKAGNGLGLIPGKKNDTSIVLVAHADTPFSSSDDHTCTIESQVIRGCGVADNSLGLAVLATLPTIFEGLGIELQSALLLLASTQSLEQGNQQGLRYFLENCSREISCGISIEGSPLGRLQYRSMASLGGMISCHVDPFLNQVGAIDILNRIIHQLSSIHLPEESQTNLVLGSVGGGASYKVPARNARLKFQLRSESDTVVDGITNIITAILDHIASEFGVTAQLEIIARTTAGGLESTHPLVAKTCEVLGRLDVRPRDIIHSSTVSGYVEHNIPAICIGISDGKNVNYPDEYVEINPILTGVAQLIGILLCIDGGCHA